MTRETLGGGSTVDRTFELIWLSASMFGACCLFSTSLIGLNKKWIKQGISEVTAFEIVNGTIMFISGGLSVLLQLKHLINFLNNTGSVLSD